MGRSCIYNNSMKQLTQMSSGVSCSTSCLRASKSNFRHRPARAASRPRRVRETPHGTTRTACLLAMPTLVTHHILEPRAGQEPTPGNCRPEWAPERVRVLQWPYKRSPGLHKPAMRVKQQGATPGLDTFYLAPFLRATLTLGSEQVQGWRQRPHFCICMMQFVRSVTPPPCM